jgi:hypothetical protein
MGEILICFEQCLTLGLKKIKILCKEANFSALLGSKTNLYS